MTDRRRRGTAWARSRDARARRAAKGKRAATALRSPPCAGSATRHWCRIARHLRAAFGSRAVRGNKNGALLARRGGGGAGREGAANLRGGGGGFSLLPWGGPRGRPVGGD